MLSRWQRFESIIAIIAASFIISTTLTGIYRIPSCLQASYLLFPETISYFSSLRAVTVFLTVKGSITPISIIQGYAEGIKVGIADGGDGVDEYCNIIIEESEKMNNLVLKLLEISQYESGLYHIQKSHFNIANNIESFLKPRVKLLKEKNITLCFNLNSEYIGYADVSTMNTVLNNYVSNAISHVSENGLILVTCTPAGEKYRVSVFNTGENIKQDDILKIWDSFYRADKSHSRSAGRFGLGLSFVRSIQEMHGNDYGVINRDNGVEFWFDISKALDIIE